MNKALRLFFITALAGFVFSCGETTTDEYATFVADGWAAFESGDYTTAYDRFSSAIASDDGQSEAYTGRGWTLMRQDNLEAAASDFQNASTRTGVSPDLYAGWAFTLNALGQHANSNTEAFEAVILSEDAWLFSHDTRFNIDDLRILEAENFYALGNFPASLIRVKLVNPSFNADVSNSTGQAQLAVEIERLRAL